MFLPSTSPFKMVKDAPILYSAEYYFLGPDLTRNTRGQYIPIFPVFFITPNLDVPARRFIPNLSYYHIIYLLHRYYYNLYMFRRSACNTTLKIIIFYDGSKMNLIPRPR